jgi:RNA polymerase-binding transcription factor DksA
MLQRVDHHQLARIRSLERLLQRHAQALAQRKHSLREELTAEAADLRNEDEAGIAREARLLGATVVGITSETVRGIETALRRLREGSYGICADCGGRIKVARLRALPFAETCIGCQGRRDARVELLSEAV